MKLADLVEAIVELDYEKCVFSVKGKLITGIPAREIARALKSICLRTRAISH